MSYASQMRVVWGYQDGKPKAQSLKPKTGARQGYVTPNGWPNHFSPEFPINERFELTRQMKRAAYSVPFNIVEGSGRNSEKDFVHFLNISFGSILEVEYCCLLSKDLKYIDTDMYEILNTKINHIKAMLIGLIKYIREPKN